MLLATVFQALPEHVDIGIMPTFSGVSLILAGTVALVYRPSDLSEIAIRSTVIGGVFGAGFWLAGLLQVASP